MNHLVILPIALPFLIGTILLIGFQLSKPVKRLISLIATFSLIPISLNIIEIIISKGVVIYHMGAWDIPFGIVLMVDRLNALMVFVLSVLASSAIMYAISRDDDSKGHNFHVLFQFQLMGINGAFLTGDLFNLFVFFEVLLISSYSLLLQEKGEKQLKSAIHYIVLNLIGSSIFLIGLSIIYGILGSVNMIDLAMRIRSVSSDDAGLIKAAGYMLLIVFGLKSAIFPLHSWLPNTYASTPTSISALFTIMSKVGFYAIVRIFMLFFNNEAGELAGFGNDILWYLALATIAVGSIGTLSAHRVLTMLGYLVLISIGTMLAGFSIAQKNSMAATLYYMVHSTWIMGALYLLSGIIVSQRGKVGDIIFEAHALAQPKLLGSLFFLSSIAVVGLPPLSGFVGKILLLSSVKSDNWMQPYLWVFVLTASFIALIALSRAGSHLFLRSSSIPIHGSYSSTVNISCIMSVIMLLCASQLVVFFASYTIDYMQLTVEQLSNLNNYFMFLTSKG